MISVIIYVHNMEDSLHVCINSVLKQSYPDFELICVDNASTDSSAEILDYFMKKDSRVRIIKNDFNKGHGSCKNQGLNASKGEYVFFLDGADWISENALGLLFENAKNECLDILIAKNIIFNKNSLDFKIEKYYDMEFMKEFESKVFNHKDLNKSLLFKMPYDSNAILYLKSFLDEYDIHFTNDKISEVNLSFFYKAFTSARKISFSGNYIYNRQISNDSQEILDKNLLLKDINLVHLVINVFLCNKELYDYYKNEILTYVFSDKLFAIYNKCNNKFKRELFHEIQMVYKSFISDYGLYKDIKNIIDEDILNIFNFDDLVDELTKDVPKISIIVPVYNVDEYLNDCLNSIINQNFRDIEVICINDGSTDKSLEILESYAKQDNRIKVITQKNHGPGHARNTGLKYAIGEYVLFVDSDDFLSKNSLGGLYFNAISNNSDLVIFNFFNFDDHENTHIPTGLLLNELFGDEDYNNFTFNYKDIKKQVMYNYFAVWFKLYKRKFLNQHNLYFPVGIAYEDVLFQIKSFIYAEKMSFLPEYLYNYRISNSSSIMHDGSKVFDIIDVTDSVENFLKDSLLYDYFELEFFMFKIIHLAHHISSSQNNEYFAFVKKEFIKLKDNNKLNMNDFSEKAIKMFNDVLKSNNVQEYLNII